MKSILAFPERGSDGNAKYRGNCSGKIVEEMIKFYELNSISDYMSGSGTTRDVAKRLNLKDCHFADLNGNFEYGQFDLVNCDIPERPHNVWFHPPYWDIIRYAGSQYKANEDQLKADLSNPALTWNEHMRLVNYCTLKLYNSMEEGGRLFVLIGDVKKKGRLYSQVLDLIKPGKLENIVIKGQFNCFSDNTVYSGKRFIEIAHEYLVILQKEKGLIIPVMQVKRSELDLRDLNSATWRDIVFEVISSNHGKSSLEELYDAVKDHKKAMKNPHFRDKIRQVVQDTRYFRRVEKGVYVLA